MKSIDLWNQLISQGYKVDDEGRLFPKNEIRISGYHANGAKAKLKVLYLEKNEYGNVSIHVEDRLYYSRFNQGVVTINLVDAI